LNRLKVINDEAVHLFSFGVGSGILGPDSTTRQDTMASDFSNELQLHLRSDYRLIFIVTSEEERARGELRNACDRAGMTLLEPRTPGTLRDLSEQLDAAGDAGTVVLVNDLHRRLEQPDVLRLLADLDAGGGCQRRAVVLTPSFTVPQELEHLSAVLELPLPTREELADVLNSVCAATGVLLVEDDLEAMVRVGRGLTEGEARRAFTKALLGWPEDAPLAREAVEKDKRKALHRSNVLEHVDVTENFDRVGGMDQLKKWLESRRKAFSREAREFGLPVPKGLLLMGIQGCGKSLTAKAVAGFWNLPLVRLDLSAVYGQPHPEESLRTALRTAEAMAPVVLWIDEIEKGFDIGGRGESARLLGGLITWLQEKQHEVFVVATANRVEALPPELPRKGRFDEIFFVDLPAPAERREILELHLRRRNLNPGDYDLEELVRRTDKFTGSELEQIIVSAMYGAFERGDAVTDADLRRALSNAVSLYETFEPEIKKLREWARKRARSASSDRSRIDYFK